MAGSEQRRPGALYRWSRGLLVAVLVVLVLSWIVTTNGMYYWFAVGANNKVRVEYGRMRWIHAPGSGLQGSRSGMGGGGHEAHWAFECVDTGNGFILRVPLWAPAALVVLVLAVMGWTRRRRLGAARADAFT